VAIFARHPRRAKERVRSIGVRKMDPPPHHGRGGGPLHSRNSLLSVSCARLGCGGARDRIHHTSFMHCKKHSSYCVATKSTLQEEVVDRG
jgi:hypothetical protein